MGTNRRTTRAATLAGVILAAGIATTGMASAEGVHSTAAADTHQRITSAAQLQAGIQLAVAGERALGPALLGTGPVGFLEN